MKIWKQRVVHVLYFHHRVIGVVIIGAGALTALWVVYVFLFTTAPALQVQEEVSNEPIKKEAIERVVTWNNDKQEQDTSTSIVPNSSFARPPAL